MVQCVSLNTPGRGLLLSACVLGVSLALSAPIASAGEATESPSQLSPQTQPNRAAQLSGGSAGMRVRIDPDTGQFKNPSADAPPTKLPPAHANAFSTSSRGLSQQPSPTPGGGVMVDVQGRFLSPLTATLSPEGKLTIQHLPSQTPAYPEKE